MNDRDSAYEKPDAFQRMAALGETYGIDQEQANQATADCVTWMREVLKKTKETKLEVKKVVPCQHCGESTTIEIMDTEKAAKAVSAIAKTMDIVVRVTAFTQGKEDSRPGMVGSGVDWMGLLFPEELDVIQKRARAKMEGMPVSDERIR